MGSAWDVAFGRLALQHGLVSQEAVRQAFQHLPPGRPLADELVRRGQLAPERAAQLTAWLRANASGSGRLPPQATAAQEPAPDDGATLRARQPAPDDGATLRARQPAPDDGATLAGGTAPTGAGPGGDRLPGVGEAVGGYTLEGLLGKGGMGAVFRARDGRTGAHVALKVLLPGADPDGSALARFRREAEALAKVDAHAGIVRVRALGEHRGLPFAVMDLVQGRDLHRIVKDEGAFEPERALRYTEAVARAVHHCHERSVLHRDLKPANVLLREHDDSPLVMDFGLALDQDAERLTRTGEVMGTPAYMSPEQAEGDKAAIDARTDVYALGAILFELVTGRPPFEGQPFEVMKKVFLDLPPPIASIVPRAPGDLDVIVRKAMAKDPALRYESAAALADDVARLRRGEPIQARAPSRREELEWRARRGDVRARLLLRAPKLAAFAVVTAVGIGLAWALRDTPARRLSSALDALDAALETAPFTWEEAPPGVVQELVGLAPPGSDDVTRLAHLVALRARPAPGFEDLGGVLGAAAPERLELLRRLVRRQALLTGRDDPSGLPLPELPTDGRSPEDHFMAVLHRVRWARSDTTSAAAGAAPPLEQLQGLLRAAAREERLKADAEALEQELKRVEDHVTAALRAGGEALVGRVSAAFRGERARSEGPAWPLEPPMPEQRPDERTRLTAFAHGVLRRDKAAALRHGIEAITSLVRADDPARWRRDQRRYQAVAAAFRDSIVPFAFAAPPVKAELFAPTGALLETLGARTREVTADQRCLEAWVDAYQAAEDFVGPLERESFRANAFDAVFLSMRSSLERGERPPLSMVMLLPALHRLPTARSSFEPFFRRAIEEREIDTWAKEHGRGDDYLVWGELLVSIRDNDVRNDRPLMATIREKYAAALGDQLDAATRARLGVGPAPTLDAPLTRYWVPRALMRVAALTARLEVTRTDGAADRATVEAALGLLRELRAPRALAPDEDPTQRQKVAREECDVLQAVHEALAGDDPAWRGELERQLEAAHREVVRLGRLLVQAASSGELRAGFDEGSFGAADARLDDEHLSLRFEGPVNDLAMLLQARGRLDEARALADEQLSFYQAAGSNLPAPLKLHLCRAALAVEAGDHALAEAAIRAILDEVAARPGVDPEARKSRSRAAGTARATLARSLARRGDRAAARQVVEAARADGEPMEAWYWRAAEAAADGR